MLEILFHLRSRCDLPMPWFISDHRGDERTASSILFYVSFMVLIYSIYSRRDTFAICGNGAMTKRTHPYSNSSEEKQFRGTLCPVNIET